MIDYIELQQKIFHVVDKIQNDDNFIRELLTKTISRREIINTYTFKNSKKKSEIIDNTKNKTIEEKKNIFFRYIDSCNDDGFLQDLVIKLYKKVKKERIDYSYFGNDINDIVETSYNIW